MGTNLNGPHGMHVVNESSITSGGHHDLANSNPNAYHACHGQNGQGTVLARVAAARTLQVLDEIGG